MARRAKDNEGAAVYTVASPTGLNVREAPDRSARVVLVLAAGEQVQQTGDAPPGWVAVNGGYVMQEFLK